MRKRGRKTSRMTKEKKRIEVKANKKDVVPPKEHTRVGSSPKIG